MRRSRDGGLGAGIGSGAMLGGRPRNVQAARLRAKPYASITDGLSRTPVGETFYVVQTYGTGVYEYLRTATGASFVTMQAYASRQMQATTPATQRPTNIAPAISGLTTHLWGRNGLIWDGRLIPNEVSGAASPTLNWLPDPFNPADEDGGTTPARTINTGSTTDPLGGSNALELTVTAQNQQNAFRVNSQAAVPATDVRIRLYTKTLSGGTAFRLGTTSGLAVTAPAAWDTTPWETTITGYTNSASVGFSSAVGNAAAAVAIAGAQMFDPLAGESASLPTLAQGLAAQNAGHLKPCLAYPGALPLTAYGAIRLDGANNATPIIYLDVNQTAQTKYSLGGAFKSTAMPVGAYGSALAFDFHTGGATNLHGQLGVYGATDPVAGRPGRLYVNPALSVSVTKCSQYFPGEGWQTKQVSVDSGDTIAYVNGIPIWLGVDGAWASAGIARMDLGAYNSTRPRLKVANAYVGEADGLFYASNKVITGAEALAQDKHIRERLRSYGQSVGPRKMAVIGCCDSLTAFDESWWWHLGESTNLSPRMHGHLDAAGGTSLSDWTASPRYDRLIARIQAAGASYDMPLCFFLAGANEVQNSWVPDGYTIAPWKVNYLAFIANVKAAHSRVKLVAMTMLPRPGFGVELQVEQLRMQWNDDLRANYQAMGFDYLIDTGLGTERVSLGGVVTAETLPGGGPMGNWRVSQGAKTSTRNPAVTLTLSALSGASFTATAPSGTFTTADIYRRITDASGEAQITALSTGAVDTVTLTSTGYTPPAMPNEPAAVSARDTFSRAALGALSLTSGNWSVKNDSSASTRLYQTDGLHAGFPGGRVLCERVWPQVQAIQDQLLGLAL